MTLGEALDKLKKDEVIQSAMPGDMLKVFMEYKTDEWEEFLATPTQWDLDKYLDCLP
jgi:glutamine synthetase